MKFWIWAGFIFLAEALLLRYLLGTTAMLVIFGITVVMGLINYWLFEVKLGGGGRSSHHRRSHKG